MTLTAEEDFADFVAARWPDLEAVALVATLDPRTARELAAESFADLRAGWDEALASGAPTAAARRALFARLGSATERDPDAPFPPLLLEPAGSDDLLPVGGAVDEAMTRALLESLAGESLLVRAAVGARAVWQLTDDELAGLLRGAADTVLPAARTARALLLSAHRGALATAGLAGQDERLDDDLAAVLEGLAAGRPDPPDPAALVAARAHRVRRRTVLVTGGALAVTGATAWWVLGGTVTGDPAPDTRATPALDAARDPDAEVWRHAATWPARGTLASDYGMQALVARQGPSARLVFADDVDDVRVVLALTGSERGSGLRPVLWAGSVGAPGEQLVPVPLAGPGGATGDVVAIGVSHPSRAILLVLADPRVAGADFSALVHPTRAGSAERTYRPVRLDAGVGSLLLDRRWGAGAAVRVDGGLPHRVPPPLAWGTGAEYGRGAILESLVGYLASVTGVPAHRIRGRTVVDSVTDGSVLDPDALSATGGDGRAVLVAATTPEGAVVRGLEVTDDGRATIARLRMPPAVVPARAAAAPALLRLVGTPPDTGRFLVVVPGGGATAQLLGTSGRAYPAGPVSNVVPMKGETAVVSVVGADLATAFRLVVRDDAGRTTYDALPPVGRDLLDPEHGLGWLGLPPDASA